MLASLARQLAVVRVEDRANTPLARRGFYDRMERAQRGSFQARFITPEELDVRNPAQISQVLGGESMVRVVRQAGKVVLSGRGTGCAMAVLVDGLLLRGMVEEVYTSDGIREHGNNAVRIEQFLRARQSVDEAVTAMSIAAIEIYPRAQTAPVELQRAAGAEACGIVALWTGKRR